MLHTLKFLVAESETPDERESRRDSVGRSSGESYMDTLRALSPGAHCTLVRPAEDGAQDPEALELASFDAVFLTGSPLHVYEDTPEVRRQLRFMRAVFASGTPSFGSCAGLQVAVAAAGGTVRENKRGREAGFARRITATEAGRTHPLLAGRPAAWDALTVHSDEVAHLPDCATLLATNAATTVQAVEVRVGHGVFWGVQYHPELTLAEIAAALLRQSDALKDQGLVRTDAELAEHVALIEALDREPARRDLSWRLGVDGELTNATHRQRELHNFIEHLVLPTRADRERTGRAVSDAAGPAVQRPMQPA